MDAKGSYSDTESDSVGSTRCEIDDLPDHKDTFIYEECSMAKETRDDEDEKKKMEGLPAIVHVCHEDHGSEHQAFHHV